MISIAKMVQAAKAAQIQAHLMQLVPALLESLSSMEVRLMLKETQLSGTDKSPQQLAWTMSVGVALLCALFAEALVVCAGPAPELCRAACGAYWG